MTAPGETIPELRPEIVFLFDVVRELAEGRLRIPRFQRPFVWRRDQMIDLLDSIYRQYPIGSLLVWETDDEIASLPSVGPVQFRQDSGTRFFVLDGHQRLSTIAGALVSESGRTANDQNDRDPQRWSIYFNARTQAFEHPRIAGQVGPEYFPMSKLLDTYEYLEESSRLARENGPNGRLFVDRVQGLARAFQNYKIPLIQIRKTGLSESVEIFARLNSRGQAMTADQMISALLYRDDADSFDLSVEIDRCVKILEGEGFGGLDRNVVLRTLLAAVGEDIYRTDWTRIASSRRDDLLGRLRSVIGGVRQSLSDACEFLRAETGVHVERVLPYAMQMTVIASFMFACPNPTQVQLELLRRWFWTSSYSGWFGLANPSRVNALVRDFMDNVASNPNTPALTSVSLDDPALPLPRSFDMRSARTRCFLLFLLSLHPLDPDGRPVLDPAGEIQILGPSALGYIFSRVPDTELARSPANRILRPGRTFRGQARSWLTTVRLTDRFDVWSSHAVPTSEATSLETGDAVEFLAARRRMLVELESQFMALRGVATALESDITFDFLVDTEEMSFESEGETGSRAEPTANA